MYLRTKEGLGDDQESWSAPQALNRVMGRPGPIGYLGNFHEQLGDPPKQTCYTVANFGPNSWGLPVDIQKDIQKIANDIVGKVERKLHQLRLKRGQKATVHLKLDIRAHLDKKTDTAKAMWSWSKDHRPPLYQRRGVAVHDDLDERIQRGLKNLRDQFNFSYVMDYGYSPQGSAHPVSSASFGKNRWVEVCICDLTVKKKSDFVH
jgi:hypothetical protein